MKATLYGSPDRPFEPAWSCRASEFLTSKERLCARPTGRSYPARLRPARALHSQSNSSRLKDRENTALRSISSISTFVGLKRRVPSLSYSSLSQSTSEKTDMTCFTHRTDCTDSYFFVSPRLNEKGDTAAKFALTVIS